MQSVFRTRLFLGVKERVLGDGVAVLGSKFILFSMLRSRILIFIFKLFFMLLKKMKFIAKIIDQAWSFISGAEFGLFLVIKSPRRVVGLCFFR